MKLGAIKRCCVEEKEFYIYESDCGEQWIGTHTAAWPVEGDLKLTEGSIAAIFDLKPKKAAPGRAQIVTRDQGLFVAQLSNAVLRE